MAPRNWPLTTRSSTGRYIVRTLHTRWLYPIGPTSVLGPLLFIYTTLVNVHHPCTTTNTACSQFAGDTVLVTCAPSMQASEQTWAWRRATAHANTGTYPPARAHLNHDEYLRLSDLTTHPLLKNRKVREWETKQAAHAQVCPGYPTCSLGVRSSDAPPGEPDDWYLLCNRLSLLLLRTAHATYLLTFPPEVPPIPSISCVLILIAALSLSTSAANWFIYSSCLL